MTIIIQGARWWIERHDFAFNVGANNSAAQNFTLNQAGRSIGYGAVETGAAASDYTGISPPIVTEQGAFNNPIEFGDYLANFSIIIYNNTGSARNVAGHILLYMRK